MPAQALAGKITKRYPVQAAAYTGQYKQKVPPSTNADTTFKPKLGTIEYLCANTNLDGGAYTQFGFSGVTQLANASVIYTSDKGYKRNGSESNAATYDDRFTTELHNGVLRGIFLWTGSLKKYKEGRYNALIESGEPVHLFHSGIGRGIRDFGRLKMLSSTMVDQGDAQVPQIKFEMVGAADRLDEEPFAA